MKVLSVRLLMSLPRVGQETLRPLIPGQNCGYAMTRSSPRLNQYCKKLYSNVMRITGIARVARKKTVTLLKYAGIAVELANNPKQDSKMKRLFCVLILATAMIATATVYAGAVKIVSVKVACGNTCTFSVTLKHADEGWEHYANQWDVMTMDDKLLKSRVLYHPHVDEQPFTRSLSGVQIPPGTTQVKVRAKDLKHGYSSEEYTVSIPGVAN